jgi:hypothetical protein
MTASATKDATTCLAEEIAEAMLYYLAEAENRYNDNHNRILLVNAEIEDLLHEIELAEFKRDRGLYLARELQNARRERRRLKAENETLFFLYDMVKKNVGFKNALINALKDIRRHQQVIDGRYYRPRVRTDLTIAAGPVVDEIENAGGYEYQEEGPRELEAPENIKRVGEAE